MKLPTIWSKNAVRDLKTTTSYWAEHNQSINYSEWLSEEALSLADNLWVHPEIGKRIRRFNTRAKVCATHFFLLYRINTKHITILRFWDTRRNPQGLGRYL